MRHFLAIADYSPEEIRRLLNLAIQLKQEHIAGGNKPLLHGKVLGMLFQKPSLRTRVSFDMAMRHLGGDALYLSPDEIGIDKRESAADISRVLSGYVDALMARVFDHDHILELARASRIPVINGLSDYNHPCQAMADMLTLQEHFEDIAGRRLAYIGDGNNVAVSLLYICTKLGVHFSIASPEGYTLRGPDIDRAREFAYTSGSLLLFTNRPEDAVRDADVVYTDTWISMGQEEETEKRLPVFQGFQVNAELLQAANPDAVVLHCLPAHRGWEITSEIADGPQSLIFPQAENRLHAQKAILSFLLAYDAVFPG
jgi:ornithine carbamoyltransferase